MGHMQLSHTRPVQSEWQGISDAENDAKTTAIYDIIGKHGGDVKVVGFVPSKACLVSVIEYPDEKAAQQSVAEILALGTLEFDAIEAVWDVVEWTSMLRAAANA
jgi:uncharacterized protein with GYD domain